MKNASVFCHKGTDRKFYLWKSWVNCEPHPKVYASSIPHFVPATRTIEIDNNSCKLQRIYYFFSGFSHQPEYHLFRLGEESSLAVKEFAETASTDILDKQKAQLAADSHLEHAKIDDFVVLDVFSSPPIESGVGTSKGTLFVDGNHTRVSLYIHTVN